MDKQTNMQRILVVDDNKTLAKLVAKKIQSEVEMEIDVAFSFAEAKLFLARYDYFITLLDVNLPDAPNGEVIDYAIEKGKHVIVLSGNVDKEFRKKMLQKNIIDYVTKGGHNDIDYIIQTIIRLKKNQNHTVMVVDDARMYRSELKKMLENLFFKVITVAHGEEALGLLSTNVEPSLIITDYNMPVMDGLELTYEIRKEYNKNQLSILALSGNDDDEISAMFLKHGANDYIKKPFSKEEFSTRVNNTVEALENIQTIINYANRDFLTGLYNRRYFYRAVEEYTNLIGDTAEQFAVAMIDIDNFKKINDTYGHDIGDRVIIALANILSSSTSPNDIVTRFGGEEFCVLLKNIDRTSAADIYERIRQNVENFSLQLDQENTIHFTISLGATMHDEEEDIDETLNKADMLLYHAKKDGKNCLKFE